MMKIIKATLLFRHSGINIDKIDIECDCSEIFSTEYILENDRHWTEYKYCPYCGKKIDLKEFFIDD